MADSPSYATLTPYLTSPKAGELVEFVKAAFGAIELYRGTGSAGGLHADVQIADSKLMIGGAPGMKPGDENRVGLHYYIPDADAVYQRAVQAGAISVREPVNQAYGDREASLKDPAGNPWYIATHLGSTGYLPTGLRSVTPFLHIQGAAGFIEFLHKAFSAEVVDRMASPEGVVHYARLRIGDSALELSEAHGEHGPLNSMFYLFVADADAAYEQALAAGATSKEKPADQDYGHRRAAVKDAFGNIWYPASNLAR
jgi:uncharacterized glyoxalase superfamily protein PhnB